MRLVLLFIFALFAVPVQAADCQPFEGIWGAERTDGTRLIVYFDDNSSSSRLNTFFELWKGKDLLARMYGVFISSQGVSVNTISVVKDYVPFDEDPDGRVFTKDTIVFSSVVEFLHLDDDEMADWLILAAFAQSQWNLGSGHVEFFAEVEDKDHAMAGPNAFKLMGCRQGPVTLAAQHVRPPSDR